ncbi:MAG: patatin-like phospholipase family protein [Hydrogenophilaceae bacterium]|jgi:NTE family protein|nr:patatin-like phospholipase family protein [Hydrogenophilaceae bacterium]
MQRALVLGGGGPVGIAWESGLAAGLAEEGVAIADADLIIGTSAGSFVGAQLASGRSPQSLAEAQIAQGRREAAARAAGAGHPLGEAPDLQGLMGLMAKAPADGPPGEALLAEFGAYANAAQTISEDAFIAGFGWIAEDGTPFPAGYRCTAIDADTGAFRTWGAEDGVPLGRAIASSCSVPGIFPPIRINGRRYIDGGMRTPTNADLAAGHERVIVVAVTIMGPFADFMRRRMQWELDAITRAGGRVGLIIPDAEALEAFGVNLMDASRRAEVAAAGVAQGRREATRARGVWG